jgi:hypothetical protein
MLTTTNRDYDPRGPAGPTAFWKISDRISQGSERELITGSYDEMGLPDGDYYPDDEVDEDDDEEDAQAEGDADDFDEDADDDEIQDIQIELFVETPAELADILARMRR